MKNRIKKVLSLLLSIIITMSFCGCAKQKEKSTQEMQGRWYYFDSRESSVTFSEYVIDDSNVYKSFFYSSGKEVIGNNEYGHYYIEDSVKKIKHNKSDDSISDGNYTYFKLTDSTELRNDNYEKLNRFCMKAFNNYDILFVSAFKKGQTGYRFTIKDEAICYAGADNDEISFELVWGSGKTAQHFFAEVSRHDEFYSDLKSGDAKILGVIGKPFTDDKLDIYGAELLYYVYIDDDGNIKTNA